MKATGPDLLPIDHGILWGPDAAQAAPGMFYHLDVPAEGRFDPLDEVTFLVRAISPDQLEPREAALERSKQPFATVVILDAGFVHQQGQDQAVRIDEQMPLAALHLFSAIIASKPPFGLVFTD